MPPLAPPHPVAPAPPPEVSPSSPARRGGRLAQPALAARRRRLALRGLGDGQAAPLGLRGDSCRNRHCPKCQGRAQAAWLAARERELLEVPYCHVVFTLPAALSPLALQNPRVVYTLLLQTVAETLQTIARDPKH